MYKGRLSESKLESLAGYKKVHLPLLITFLIISTFGLVMLFSASLAVSYAREGGATEMFIKQAGISTAGLLVALLVALAVPIRHFNRPVLRYIVYAVVSVLLLALPFVGTTINGARRWIFFGSISVQPSELAKIAAVYFLATYFSEQRKKRRQNRHKKVSARWQPIYDAFVQVTLPALMVIAWIVLILIQPHMSGAIIMTLLVIFMFVVEGFPFKRLMTGATILLIFLLIALMLFLMIGPVMTGQSPGDFIEDRFAHVFRRLTSFTSPEEANPDDTRQIEQAQIALGSGGLFGVGLGRSVQKMNWLPESHNDFILAIIGEELGFAGTFLCLMLFVLFFIFGMSVALNAATSMTTLIAAGYTFLITVQALLNFGVATHVLPTTGISLPFFSYGGTANFFFMLASGMILCVSKSGKREDPEIAQYLEPEKKRQGKSAKPRKRTQAV
ncbi:MAG TPA: cell division protein FtsW [Fastidiosipila sp.]|nr:cell division protein FtsW [Fastidiosipila sp.]